VKRRRHTPEQIVRKLREADKMLAEGVETPEVCKALEVSESTYHRWRAAARPRDNASKAVDQEHVRLRRTRVRWQSDEPEGNLPSSSCFRGILPRERSGLPAQRCTRRRRGPHQPPNGVAASRAGRPFG